MAEHSKEQDKVFKKLRALYDEFQKVLKGKKSQSLKSIAMLE